MGVAAAGNFVTFEKEKSMFDKQHVLPFQELKEVFLRKVVPRWLLRKEVSYCAPLFNFFAHMISYANLHLLYFQVQQVQSLQLKKALKKLEKALESKR